MIDFTLWHQEKNILWESELKTVFNFKKMNTSVLLEKSHVLKFIIFNVLSELKTSTDSVQTLG